MVINLISFVKALIAGITEVLDSAKLLIKAKKALADTLDR